MNSFGQTEKVRGMFVRGIGTNSFLVPIPLT